VWECETDRGVDRLCEYLKVCGSFGGVRLTGGVERLREYLNLYGSVGCVRLTGVWTDCVNI